MKKYQYKIIFKIKGEVKYRYNMTFTIEADSNENAKAQGGERWREQVAKRERLKEAQILKITCRACETKPRAPKLSPLQKALKELNNYICEELNN